MTYTPISQSICVDESATHCRRYPLKTTPFYPIRNRAPRGTACRCKDSK